MLISCGHSICEACLRDYVSDNRPLNCIECDEDETVYIPSFDYIEKFPVN